MITENKVATIDYKLYSEDGTIVDGGTSFSYLHGMNNILIGMENALTGKNTGDDVEVDIPPAQGFGEVQNFDMFVSSMLLLYYILWKNKSIESSVSLSNSATELNAVIFNRDSFKTF